MADARRTRPYLFYDTATSVCATCLRRVEAKILLSNDEVVMEKWCPEHGKARVLLADDVAYWRRAREFFLKAPELPVRFATPTRWGCPYDCGLCPDHMQHSCLALLEITDRCNLRCPVCYAGSGPERTEARSLVEIEKMLDALVEGEGEPDVVQISGGEPTIHPDFFAILDAARRRPIRHLMVNTNGIRIAADAAFAERLASYAPGFEVYLQFDSLDDAVNRVLRGAPLLDQRLKALERLNELNLSTTLVVTVVKGLNDGEIGKLVDVRPRAALRPRRHAPAGPGRGPDGRRRARPRPTHADRGAAAPPRAVRRLPARGRRPRAVQPGRPRHGVRAQGRGPDRSAHGPSRSRGAPRRGAQYDRVREGRGREETRLEAVFDGRLSRGSGDAR